MDPSNLNPQKANKKINVSLWTPLKLDIKLTEHIIIVKIHKSYAKCSITRVMLIVTQSRDQLDAQCLNKRNY